MKKKILFVAHMDSHIANFHLPYLEWFQRQGYETHVASNSLEKTRDIKYCDVKHQIDFKRSPFSRGNLKAYKQFKRLIKATQYELVHAHTPMGGIFVRMAFRKTRVPVFYTAHGFHFLKGGSKLSWLLYYPVERWLSRYTNEIITINDEDYQIAKKKFNKKCHVTYVPGVGVDLLQYQDISDTKKKEVRSSLGLKDDDFLLVYVAEQTVGKNQMFLIDMMYQLKGKYPNMKLLLIGYGKEATNHKEKIKAFDLEDTVLQLGFRYDIVELTSIADLIVSASLREGLPKALLEALSIGKPMLVTNIRGNKDIVINGFNGCLYEPNDASNFKSYLDLMYHNKELLEQFSTNSKQHAKKFDINRVLKQITLLYDEYLKEGNINE
ncbi:Glycosyl transferase, group 1 [Paracholeplasma brassicae]|uniref:Glycosyl transferase, group 1 n=1 Tax=Acholeplasma brassicae TaxID=61635 RepID=U4KM95_9MOLU|nr:glycosyltransferase family 4 protein [Paracholeplasma brassicae]CCV65136.1 Glycosyl transferase, group 1 [Paracholeplasma brassicae]